MQKYNDFLKFSFFEKATKICTILLSKRQNHKEDGAYICGFLRIQHPNKSEEFEIPKCQALNFLDICAEEKLIKQSGARNRTVDDDLRELW